MENLYISYINGRETNGNDFEYYEPLMENLFDQIL